MLQKGAWWDPSGLPVSRNALLQTPSGKFEFYSTRLKQLLDKSATTEDARKSMLAKFGADKSEDLLYLPAVAIRSAKKVEAFPLRLNTYRLMSRPMGGGKNQPWLLGTAGGARAGVMGRLGGDPPTDSRRTRD